MLYASIAGNLMLSLAAILSIVGSVYGVRKLVKLRKRFNSSIVLIPLYKKKAPIIVAASVIFILGCGTIAAMAYQGSLYLYINLLLILASAEALMVELLAQRFAVVDTGIIVPYRFIDWLEFTDYFVEGNTIFFTGDKYGFSSLTSTTLRLRFNAADMNKLQLILSRNKQK